MNSSNEIWEKVIYGDFVAFNSAMDKVQNTVRSDDLSLLFQAYQVQRSWDVRTDIIDLIGRIGTSVACEFLTRVSQSRDHYLVRYHAMINLIEMNCGEWRPESKRKLRTDFYASLASYEDYLRGKLSFEELHDLALTRSTKNGDHWEWLTHLTKEGRRA